jgi:hypothetical protein
LAIPLDLDILVYAWSTLRVLLGSKDRLRKNSKPIPAHYDIEELADSQLTQAQRNYLAPIDTQLAALNFLPHTTFRVKNQGTNLLRRYFNPADSASCALTIVEVKVNVNGLVAVRNASHVAFTTRLQQDKLFVTRNMAQKSLFDSPTYITIQDCPNTTDLASLKRQHDSEVSKHGPATPPPSDPAGVFAEVQTEHERYSKFQLERGVYSLAPDGRSYLLNDKVFNRGIRNHFLPFGRRISFPQVLFSALIGAVLPLLGILRIAPWIAARNPNDSHGTVPAAWIAIALCYCLAGLILGYICEIQKFTWVMLIAYVPAHFVAGWSFGWLPYTTLAYVTSYFISQAKQRKKLVLQA